MVRIKIEKALEAAQGWVAAALVAFILAFSAGPVRASDTGDFHQRLADAYRHYREASFYLRTGNDAVASFELQDLKAKWQALTSRFADSPPDVYADDKRWKTDLRAIADRIDQGIAATDAGDLKQARKVLRPIRKMLGELRARNGVFLYSDCIDRANAAFAALWRFRRDPPDFDKPDEVDAARKAAAVTSHWYRRCLDMAPPAAAADPQFRRTMETGLESLDRLWVTLRQRDRVRFISILRELHAWDGLLYLRHG